MRKLFQSAEECATEKDIANLRVAGLTKALDNEKKKRQTSKRLDILGPESTGARFLS